jgi:hypothetical protein
VTKNDDMTKTKNKENNLDTTMEMKLDGSTETQRPATKTWLQCNLGYGKTTKTLIFLAFSG